MRIGVVVNPVSGSRGRRARSAQDRVALARRFADRRRTIDLETAVTTAAGHAIELAVGLSHASSMSSSHGAATARPTKWLAR